MWGSSEAAGPARLVFVSAARQSWGAEQSMYAIAAGAKARGIEIALLCFEGTIGDDWFAAVGTPAREIPHGGLHRSSKLSENRELWAAYISMARPYDRVSIFTYYLAVGSVATRALLGRGIRFSLDLHDNLPGAKGRFLLRMSLAGIHRVICCSRYTASQLAVPGTRVPDKAVSLHGPAEGLDVHGGPSVDGRLRVCIAGRIISEKRHDLVVAAVARLEGTARLILRGTGDGSVHDNSTEVLPDARDQLGDAFSYEGKVPPEQVLDDIDVMVVANGQEPMGRTVLEAQLSGVLAVVPDTGGAAELVRDGSTGLVFRAGDANSLAMALRRVREDPDLMQRIREQALTHAEARSVTEVYVSRYLGLLVD